MSRWAWVEVSAAAIEHNTRTLCRTVAPARVWAVVKADGYGHGALTAARAALDGGASALCVALVQEGVALREAGIGVPVLVLTEQPPEEVPAAVAHGLDLTVYSAAGVAAIESAGGRAHPVHLKIDTGMRRVGVPPDRAVAVADAIAASPATQLAGVSTHFAVADDPTDPFTAEQLARFERVLDALRAGGHHPGLVHAANSAGALAVPDARFDAVRAGISIYGISPGHGVDHLCTDLRPALSLRARVAHVGRVGAGEGISYGLRHRFTRDSTVAVLPIGYADGVPRRLFEVGGAVLLGGRRRPIVGVVTMDQTMVDCGDDQVAVGEEAVLLGRQGTEEITATEWADRLGTIAYEVTCALSARLARL